MIAGKWVHKLVCASPYHASNMVGEPLILVRKPGVPSSLTGQGGIVRTRKITSGMFVFVFWFLLLEPAMYSSYS